MSDTEGYQIHLHMCLSFTSSCKYSNPFISCNITLVFSSPPSFPLKIHWFLCLLYLLSQIFIQFSSGFFWPHLTLHLTSESADPLFTFHPSPASKHPHINSLYTLLSSVLKEFSCFQFYASICNFSYEASVCSHHQPPAPPKKNKLTLHLISHTKFSSGSFNNPKNSTVQ